MKRLLRLGERYRGDKIRKVGQAQIKEGPRDRQRNLDLVLEVIRHHCRYWCRDMI